MIDILNGSYKNSIIIREKDDTFVFIKNVKVILLNKNKPFNEQYDYIIQTTKNTNIVIDNRLFLLIYYSIIRSGDNILIYHISDKKVYNIYTYLSLSCGVSIQKINPRSISNYALINYIIIHYLGGIIKLDRTRTIEKVLMKSDNIYLSMDVFIDNFIYSKSSSMIINNEMIVYNYLIKLFSSIEHKQFNILPLMKIYPKLVITTGDIFDAFMRLHSNEIVLSFIPECHVLNH